MFLSLLRQQQWLLHEWLTRVTSVLFFPFYFQTEALRGKKPPGNQGQTTLENHEQLFSFLAFAIRFRAQVSIDQWNIAAAPLVNTQHGSNAGVFQGKCL